MKQITAYFLAFIILFLSAEHSFAYGDSAGSTAAPSFLSKLKKHKPAKKIGKHHRHSTKKEMSDFNLTDDDFQIADSFSVAFVVTTVFALAAFFLSEVRGNAPNFAEIHIPEKTRRFILLRNLRI